MKKSTAFAIALALIAIAIELRPYPSNGVEKPAYCPYEPTAQRVYDSLDPNTPTQLTYIPCQNA